MLTRVGTRPIAAHFTITSRTCRTAVGRVNSKLYLAHNVHNNFEVEQEEVQADATRVDSQQTDH